MHPITGFDEVKEVVYFEFFDDSYAQHIPDLRDYDPVHVCVFVDMDNMDLWRAASREEEKVNTRISAHFKDSVLFSAIHSKTF